MDTQISNLATAEVDEDVRNPISKDGDVESRNFSTDFMCKTSDDLLKEIENLLRIYGLSELIKAVNDLVFLNMLICYKPAEYIPDGPEGYNTEVSEHLGTVSWDIYQVREMARLKIQSKA